MIQALARLLPYIVRVRRPLIIGLACIVVATGVSLISPWLLKYVIDGLVEGVSRMRLAVYALALVLLALVDGWFRYLTRIWLIGASRQIEYDLRSDFFAHLERLPQAFFHANRTGDLMSRATNDLGAVRMLIGPAVMYLASTALGFVIAVVVMFWIDPRLTLIALLPLPGVTIATRYFGKAIHDRFERIQAQLADMSVVVQEALAGVRVVRAYRQEEAQTARFRSVNDEYVARNRGLIRLQAAFYPSLTLCFGLSGILVLWMGGRDVIDGRLTLGEFVAFSRYLVMLSWPLIAFGWVINLFQRGLASWERLLEVFDAPVAEPVPPPRSEVLGRTIRGRVEARHLTFRYPGSAHTALHDVSFVLDAGKTLAVVGPTGSGKSTIAKLLARLHDPPRGTLFIDDVDVLDIPMRELRAALGMAAQDPFLFSTTIGGNVAFGVDADWTHDPVRTRVTQAGELAGLSSDIAAFPAGYETVIGERGITLSGGQKQRVALARTVVTDPRVLVLDDTLSAVDTATEEAILIHLREARRSRTAIVIAHRISTVRDADEALVLAHGAVVERGTHDELVAAGGMYADMHRRQLLEEELANV